VIEHTAKRECEDSERALKPLSQTSPSLHASQLTQASSITAEAEASPIDEYVQCDFCDKWRLVTHRIISEQWVCADNIDQIYNHCDVPQDERIQTDAEESQDYTQSSGADACISGLSGLSSSSSSSSNSCSSSGVESGARASGLSSSSSISGSIEGGARLSGLSSGSSSSGGVSTPAFPAWALAPYMINPEYAQSVQAGFDAAEAARSAQAAEPAGAKRAKVIAKCRHCHLAHEGPGCVFINHNYLYRQPKNKGIVDAVLAAPVVPAEEREYLRQGFRPSPSPPAHNSTTNL
jgi:hypothetical protein